MPDHSALNKIAFLGNYLPRRCGIATFTHDLCQAVANRYPELTCEVAAVSDGQQDYEYPREVIFSLREQALEDYQQGAEFLRVHNAQLLCVQHEYGIFGGADGEHVLTLLREVKIPIVTTLHTILTEPSASQRRIMNELVRLSQRVVTMSAKGVNILRETYQVPEQKIALIPHGIPDMPFVDPAFYKDKFGVEGKRVLLTFGLLSPGKGLEYAIEALPEIVARHPDVVYVILGATHPNLVRHEGEAYRESLMAKAEALGVAEHVKFFNQFVSLAELKEFIGACDIYLTPYLNPAQITSGTLAYAFGCGKAVVSTPYWHAEELLQDGRGALVPFRDAAALATTVNQLLADDSLRNGMRKQAYMEGRTMIWSEAAGAYMKVFKAARLEAQPQLPRAVPGPVRADTPHKRLELPRFKLDHLARMTDSTGIFQHALYSFPNFSHGYCVDDNARALLLAVQLDEVGLKSPQLLNLTRTYAAFMQDSFNPATGRFRNFMGFDRRWLEDAGSEDSQARSLWALGACVARSSEPWLKSWAAQLFEEALPGALQFTAPRAVAFTLLGLDEFQRHFHGMRSVLEARQTLAARLYDYYQREQSTDWPWFEPILAYDNAKLPHALLLGANALESDDVREAALGALEWLCAQQTDEQGAFQPVGCHGFYPKGGTKAQFDQQPIEAHATVAACLCAYHTTRERRWLDEADRAFRWFLGSNKLGLALYDEDTGGCRDGLQMDRVNHNQGAESTLCFWLAYAELKRIQSAESVVPAKPGLKLTSPLIGTLAT